MSAISLLDLSGRASVPVIQQTEASECALACLAMVASYHGFQTDLPSLRRRFSLSLKGASLKTLMSMAEQTGFCCRALRAEIGDLDKLQLPAILHWNLDHFVVLTRIRPGVRQKRYEIHDPALGKRVIDEDEVSRRFTGVLVELTKSDTFRRRSEKSRLQMKQLWSKMRGLPGSLGNLLFLSAIIQLFALASPFYLQLAIDTALPAFDADLLKMLAIGFGGLALIGFVTSWLRSLLLVTIGNAFSYQVIVNLFRHLMRLSLPWFEKRHVGDVVSRFGSTQPISDLLSQGLIAAVIDGVMAVLTLALMFLYSPKLAGIAFVAWLLFLVVKIGSYHAVRMKNVDVITAAARENSSFIESVRGISAIKAFGQEGNRQRLWQQLKADSVNANIKLGRITSGFDAIGQFILAAERVIFVFLALRMAMEGDFTVGMIFAFQAYKQHFLDASTRLVDFGVRLKLLDVHLERIADIALSPAELPSTPRCESLQPVQGGVELRNVGFRYGLGEAEVLRGVNLRVAPGEMVAFIGPSGGGKTTLLKIMMGLIEPTVGQVLVDGKSLAGIGLDHWRRQIGSVAQDDLLYAGSLADNISFFDPEISMQKVVDAARLSEVHETIEHMPMRYDSLVGDMGSTLSGGQRQRVILARALYPDPAVIFLDEVTSHLDAANEHKLVQTIQNLPFTRIITSHRVAIVNAADKVFMVANGSVVSVPKTMVEPLLAPSGEVTVRETRE